MYTNIHKNKIQFCKPIALIYRYNIIVFIKYSVYLPVI